MSNNPGVIRSIPPGAEKSLEASLVSLVDGSQGPGGHPDQEAPSVLHADAIHTTGHHKSRRWIAKLWPSEEMVDKLFAYEHMGKPFVTTNADFEEPDDCIPGNYVIDRKTGKKIFETMPLYVRVGMHLLFCEGKEFISYERVEDLLKVQSVRQGKLYDKEGPEVLPHIQSFIQTYNLPLNELLIEDLTQYPTFNSFFARRLKASARPIDSHDDSRTIVSPADCRMTVFESQDQAKKFWVKGKQFSVPELLGHDERFSELQKDTGCMLSIARLAPQDYHRFHFPVKGVVQCIKDIEGELYTVNPQAVNEDLNVFTKNKRSVMLLNADLGPEKEQTPVALVAIGAMLVGSIGWSAKPGDAVKKGAEAGWFAYGGSTLITVFPSRAACGLRFDDDLVKTSEETMEMAVQVGNRIGVVQ
ncbi:hypothetical protein NliqN6_6152 [Naganishia liquefaciens]|uniref:phosphatidylserine decarboxylase n=1 Tax=Naganishia liquefaciens TaxID=104408 RepID=A0A8H3TYW4_9TREE|nr:hypothetical protein NliqN6_6152 [Naganishia liquefaciens]